MVYDIFFKEIFLKICTYKKNVLPLQRKKARNGTLADRLGNGLQNRVEQFDSARYLLKRQHSCECCLFYIFMICLVLPKFLLPHKKFFLFRIAKLYGYPH